MMIAQIFAVVFAILIQSTPSHDSSLELNIMSFNIRYGTADDGDNNWPYRNQLVMSVIKSRNADIVGLQEALGFQLDEITAKFPGYSVIGVGRDDGRTQGEFSAILYRTDRFNIDTSGTFWLSDTPDLIASTSWGNSITRICTWARLVERQSGEAFYIYNTHYDHRSQPSREMNTTLISNQIFSRRHHDPVVLMGDFNAGETNPAIINFGTLAGLEHTYRSIHPNETAVGTFNAFNGKSDGEMIDHIFVTPDIKITDAGIDHTNNNARYPSDHFPVWATIELPITDQ